MNACKLSLSYEVSSQFRHFFLSSILFLFFLPFFWFCFISVSLLDICFSSYIFFFSQFRNGWLINQIEYYRRSKFNEKNGSVFPIAEKTSWDIEVLIEETSAHFKKRLKVCFSHSLMQFPATTHNTTLIFFFFFYQIVASNSNSIFYLERKKKLSKRKMWNVDTPDPANIECTENNFPDEAEPLRIFKNLYFTWVIISHLSTGILTWESGTTDHWIRSNPIWSDKHIKYVNYGIKKPTD